MLIGTGRAYFHVRLEDYYFPPMPRPFRSEFIIPPSPKTAFMLYNSFVGFPIDPLDYPTPLDIKHVFFNKGNIFVSCDLSKIPLSAFYYLGRGMKVGIVHPKVEVEVDKQGRTRAIEGSVPKGIVYLKQEGMLSYSETLYSYSVSLLVSYAIIQGAYWVPKRGITKPGIYGTLETISLAKLKKLIS